MKSKQDAPTFSFPEMDPDRRLAELILYIAEKCEHDPGFGAVKLNKILAFADFSSYFETGKPITGAEYMRLPQGPAPRRLLRRSASSHTGLPGGVAANRESIPYEAVFLSDEDLTDYDRARTAELASERGWERARGQRAVRSG